MFGSPIFDFDLPDPDSRRRERPMLPELRLDAEYAAALLKATGQDHVYLGRPLVHQPTCEGCGFTPAPGQTHCEYCRRPR